MSRRGAWPEATPPERWFEEENTGTASAPGPRRWEEVWDKRLPEAVDRAPTLAEAVRVAVEAAPAAGNEAPDRVLGPWADGPVSRELLAVAVATAAWFTPDVDDEAPWGAWARQEPRPAAVERARFRAVADAPWGLWWLDGEGERVFLRDTAGLGPRWLPTEAVWVRPVPLCGPLRAVAARVILTRDGPVAVTPIGFPGLPDDVRARADRIVEGVASADPHASREEALRRQGHALVRSICEWLWVRQ